MKKLTLTQVFVLTFAGVAIVVGALFYGVLESSRRSLVERSERYREAAASRIDARITRDLGEAADVLADVERGVRAEAIDGRSPEALEPALFALLLAHPNVSDIALTHPDRWQISVYRASADAKSGIVTRIVVREGERFVARLRTRVPDGKLRDGAETRSDAVDPTGHLTYRTTVSDSVYGTAIWSDLHYSELDQAEAESARRVVVSVQKAIDDASGKRAGVVRVGIRAVTVDTIAATKVDESDANDPHRVFLCDAEGRLLTRLDPSDRLMESGDDLRVQASSLPPEIARALASPALRDVSFEHPFGGESFVVGGKRYLLTLRALEDTQGWIAAILVPEEHYTRDLRALRDRFVLVNVAGASIALIGGALLLASMRAGLRRMMTTTQRMRDFDFREDPRTAALRDVDEVLGGLERAKTAMRALGKYVPVDLVRRLYASNREPALGGELAELTVMFTDIRGFTDLSEKLTPNELAVALGKYLDAMTTAIGATGGTIDKFIGDAVMALWNAPTPLEHHAERACEAALACAEATAKLFASDAWRGLPALVTRFGIHTDRVLVGHFGSPARLSYTALGDGVNLAARLESLCKQYGVVRIVSEAVALAAHGSFLFRKLDRVAVKGKTRGVVVYELIGRANDTRPPQVDQYERALEAYFARGFDEAVALLEPIAEVDPPARVLLERCRAFRASPPPVGWDGTFIASSK